MPRRKSSQHDQKQGQRWALPVGSKVWVYLRHSPGDTQNIDSQQSGMRSWCAESGWLVEKEFIDAGIEGSKEQREQFQEMMALARQEPRAADGIVVWSFSRFARDLQDAQFYKAWLRKMGYTIISKIDDIPDSEIAPIIESMVDWKNQRFLDDLSFDTKRGLLYLVERGYWPGSIPPIGYRVEQEEIGRRNNGDTRYGNRLVKDDEVSDRVALAWKMKLQDNASYRVIHQATRLFVNIHNYGYFFDNMLYTGILEYGGKRYPNDWEQGTRFCETYVTLEEFYQVQQNRQRRTIDVVPPRSLSSPYLLTGILHCAYCDTQGIPSTMAGAKQWENTEHRYYRCQSRGSGRSPDCKTPHVACWKIDDMVLGTLREMVLTPDYIKAEIERANAKLVTKGHDIQAQLHQAERAVKEQERRVLSLVTLIEKKSLTPLLERQYDEANKAYLDATTQLAMLRSQSVQVQVNQISSNDAHRFS